MHLTGGTYTGEGDFVCGLPFGCCSVDVFNSVVERVEVGSLHVREDIESCGAFIGYNSKLGVMLRLF